MCSFAIFHDAHATRHNLVLSVMNDSKNLKTYKDWEKNLIFLLALLYFRFCLKRKDYYCNSEDQGVQLSPSGFILGLFDGTQWHKMVSLLLNIDTSSKNLQGHEDSLSLNHFFKFLASRRQGNHKYLWSWEILTTSIDALYYYI